MNFGEDWYALYLAYQMHSYMLLLTAVFKGYKLTSIKLINIKRHFIENLLRPKVDVRIFASSPSFDEVAVQRLYLELFFLI